MAIGKLAARAREQNEAREQKANARIAEAKLAILKGSGSSIGTATEELLSGVAQYVFERQRASCHPTRLAFKDGRCFDCVAEEMARLDHRQRPAAVAHQEVVRLGEEALARQVRGYLQANLEEYARLHIEATRLAAFKGDARPAEWALQSVKVADGPIVSAPAKEGGGGGGVKVMIGVQLGGLPPGTENSLPVRVTETVPAVTNGGEGD